MAGKISGDSKVFELTAENEYTVKAGDNTAIIKVVKDKNTPATPNDAAAE